MLLWHNTVVPVALPAQTGALGKVVQADLQGTAQRGPMLI